MASTRSNRSSPSAAQPAVKPSAAVKATAREGARIQLAVLCTAGKALADWTDAADRLTHAVGAEVVRRLDGEIDSRELIVAVAAATTVHLHDLAALPRSAANHFDTHVMRASIDA